MIRRLTWTVHACALGLLLTGCAHESPLTAADPMTPMPAPAPVIDPDDGVFIASVNAYLQERGAPAFSRYEFARADLDGDGRREGLLLFNSPYHYWCDPRGCALLVFQAHNDGFSVLSETAPVRGPLTISATQSHKGWRDLIIRQSGQLDTESRYAALRFDGHGYPASPDESPTTFAHLEPASGQALFP